MAKSAVLQHFSTEIRTKNFELPRISRSLTALRATWWSPRCANPHRRGGRRRVCFPPASRWRHLLGRSCFFFTTNGTCMGHSWDITFMGHLYRTLKIIYGTWHNILIYTNCLFSSRLKAMNFTIGSINQPQLQIYGTGFPTRTSTWP